MGRSYNGFFRWALILAGLIVLGATSLLVFSPYKHYGDMSCRLVSSTVEIDAPSKKVYDYLGRSANASRWSTFVSHITPLNETEYQDGSVNSCRRCFHQQDEHGMQWDEKIIRVEPERLRTLTIFNLQNFPLQASNLVTDQVYRSSADGRCLLTFRIYFLGDRASFADRLKMFIAAYQIQHIFDANLANIKKLNE